MPFTEATKITLEAGQAVELYAGVVLPPGSYSGIKARAQDNARNRQVSTTTRFRIELTAEQLADMGATLQPNQDLEEIDVTEFVRQGQLTIR
jgi:hypothetical protein